MFELLGSTLNALCFPAQAICVRPFPHSCNHFYVYFHLLLPQLVNSMVKQCPLQNYPAGPPRLARLPCGLGEVPPGLPKLARLSPPCWVVCRPRSSRTIACFSPRPRVAKPIFFLAVVCAASVASMNAAASRQLSCFPVFTSSSTSFIAFLIKYQICNMGSRWGCGCACEGVV